MMPINTCVYVLYCICIEHSETDLLRQGMQGIQSGVYSAREVVEW